MFCLFYKVNSVEVSSRTAEVRGKSGKTLSNDYKLNLPAEKSENVHASPKPSVQQLDTAVSSSKTPTEIYNNNLNINNNHDTNSRRPETGFLNFRGLVVNFVRFDTKPP